MSHPTVTLTTDFGLADHFVGSMKGAILSECPAARLVDITHLVPPFEVAEGAYELAQAFPIFPRGTVHLAVVDPGVGTSRRAVAAKVAGQFLVGPDNGVLSHVLASHPSGDVREITNSKLFRHPVSSTFHGRDVFAPIAGRLAGGLPFARLGPRVDDWTRLASTTPHRTAKRTWVGSILKVDRFGNLITSFRLSEFPDMLTRGFEMAVGQERIHSLAATYAQSPIGHLTVVEGSGGYLEVISNQASAAKLLGCGLGAPVELTILQPLEFGS